MGHIIQVEDFEPLLGSEVIARIQAKAQKLQNVQVLNFNSTYYGGGVVRKRPSPRAAAALRLAPIRAVGLIEINF